MSAIIGELLFIVWLTTLSLQSISAQQVYGGNKLFDCKDNSAESSGYVCNGAEKSCDSYALFHAQPPYQSLFSISKLFNVGISELASASNLSTRDTVLERDQGVLIPLRCGCVGNHYQASLRSSISNEDSYFSLTKALEGLTSCEVLRKQNPGRHFRMGSNMLIPLRCACPTAEQIKQGFKYLMTYALKNGDTLDTVADTFDTSWYDIVVANTFQGVRATFFSSGSVLVPLKNKPVIHPAVQVPASATLPPPNRGVHNISSNGIKTRRKKKISKSGLCIGIVAGTIAVIGVIGAILLVTRRNKSLNKPAAVQYMRPVVPKSEDGSVTGKNAVKERMTGMTDLLMLTYTLDQLNKATENFSPDCRIEGSVYHGILSGTPLAIKQIKVGISDDLRSLCQIQHSNLIRFLGICNEGEDHSYLVFEYAENGSLSDWLHGGLVMKNKFITSCSRFLAWDQRLNICLDVAMGLHYIHKHKQPSYVHKDIITSSKILLNAELKAKIANFNMGTKHNISGTPGYMAPEYISHGQVTTKIDIYAFGVVLLEILSGQLPITMKGTQVLLAETIGPLLEASNPTEQLKDWMDPSLHEVYAIDQALALAKLAKSCVEQDPSVRPTMDEITERLTKLVEASSIKAEMSMDANNISNV